MVIAQHKISVLATPGYVIKPPQQSSALRGAPPFTGYLLGPRSTQPPLAPAASRLQYGRRRNANASPERGHIERIEPILAIIAMEKLLIFQPKWVIYMSNITFCLIKTCAQISNSLLKSVKLSTFAQH